jgi:FAD/FMN-containing dehydrogenase
MVRAMTTWADKEIWGWGRYPRVTASCARPERRREVIDALRDRGDAPVLAHGLGRSYGDAALLEGGRVLLTRRLDRLLDFDPETGWVRAEAGVSIEDLLRTFVPRGFFPPIVPGTQFVTLGGALASDIHGKNHHVDGSFADHVRRVELLTASGEVVTCDADHHPDLFWATVGGQGLTGVILALDLRLVRIDNPYIEMESIRVENLDHFFEVSAESGEFTHTVSWIDCVARGASMGRGIFMRGRHASAAAAPAGPGLGERLKATAAPILDVPFDAPGWLLNNLTIRAFNEAYFRKQIHKRSSAVVHYEPFFFPLDMVRDWNRLYGARGFLQYQLVVPPDPEHRAIRAVLEAITASGMGSFLAVIKEFGEKVHGGLSFPAPGVTLALDFPNYGQPLFDLLNGLDAIVAEAGGRVYLCKDARLARGTFRRMYPEWEAWRATRDRWDPHGVFRSALGRRLGLVPEGDR